MSGFDNFFTNMPSRQEMQERGHAARMSADDGETPEIGKTYTVSPSFNMGDRSWIDCLWKVEGISGPNVAVRIIGGHEDVKRIVRADERAWYPAEDLSEFLKARGEL